MILYLLRHAKSSWSDPGVGDHDRPLTPRGQRGARTIGRWLAARPVQPALVLCSSARRAVDTLELVLAELPHRPEVRVERGLYMSDPDSLLDRIQQVGRGVEAVMMVGHNPATAELATRLCGSGDAEAQRRLRSKYPTAAVAELRFDGDDWGQIAFGNGELLAFCTPRELED